MLDVVNQRRAVYTALKPYFDTNSLFELMWLWENKYSRDYRSKLGKFVEEIARNRSLDDRINAIRHDLVSNTFFSPIDRLDPDPYADMLNYLPNHLVLYDGDNQHSKLIDDRDSNDIHIMSQDHVKPEESKVFETVLQHFFLQIEKQNPHHAHKVRDQVIQELSCLEMDPGQRHELMRWLKGETSELCMRYSESTMSVFVHSCYVNACELCGPIKADSYLAYAIEIGNGLPEASRFSPLRL